MKSLEQDSVKCLCWWKLDQKMIQVEQTVNEKYAHIRTCIKEVVYESGQLKITKKPYWWDEEIEQKLKRRKHYMENSYKNKI